MADNEMIWVVDDDPAIRELLSFIVKGAGYDVDAFASGAEVLASSVALALHRHTDQISEVELVLFEGWQRLAIDENFVTTNRVRRFTRGHAFQPQPDDRRSRLPTDSLDAMGPHRRVLGAP